MDEGGIKGITVVSGPGSGDVCPVQAQHGIYSLLGLFLSMSTRCSCLRHAMGSLSAMHKAGGPRCRRRRQQLIPAPPPGSTASTCRHRVNNPACSGPLTSGPKASAGSASAAQGRSGRLSGGPPRPPPSSPPPTRDHAHSPPNGLLRERRTFGKGQKHK